MATVVTSRTPMRPMCSPGWRRATSPRLWPAVPSGHGVAPESEPPSDMETPFGSTPPAPRSGPPAQKVVRAVLVDGEIHVHVPHPSPLIAQVRTLPGRRWDPGRRVWRMPDSDAGREAVRSVLGVEVDAPPHGEHPASLPRPETPPGPGLVDRRVERFDEEMRLRGYAAPRGRPISAMRGASCRGCGGGDRAG